MKTTTILIIVAAIVAACAAGWLIYSKYVKQPTTVNAQPVVNQGSGNGTVAPSSGNGTVAVQAFDANDPYPRDWNIFTSDPSGTYKGGGNFSAGIPIKTENHQSGDTWTVSLPKGTYYLLIGQSGGESFGTYAGTITVNGNAVPFANIDVSKAAQFTIS